MFNIVLTTPISALISLAALAGVTLHDTRVDKLATALSGIPAMMTTTENGSKVITNDPHTHVERVSLSDNFSAEPRISPRSEHKKHLMQKNVPRGAHRFDGYNLPQA
jgi:hypothetical protein